MTEYVVITFYKFIFIEGEAELQLQLMKFCKQYNIKGTILIASEGINSTLVGNACAIDAFQSYIKSYDIFSDIYVQKSFIDFLPFHKLKVKIKKEIVTFEEHDLKKHDVGIHIEPKEWDDFLRNKDEILVIDTRNDYEVAIGTFENAITPNIKNFTQFKYWAKTLSVDSDKKIAMFCTGGVRCEKSTAYMKSLGYKNVYQLKGGILNYLSTTKNKSGKWQGKCFVFDDRKCLNAELKPHI